MKITPLFDRVVLRTVKEEPSNSPIILPESQTDKSEVSIVEEIGTGGLLNGNEIKWQIKKGDKVIYNKFSAHEFHINGETFTIISQDDILGIIN